MSQTCRTYAVVTLFPNMFDALRHGIPAQAKRKGLYRLLHVNPRHYADNKHGHIDDRPYGGGPGMVMCAPPISRSIAAAKKKLGANTLVVHFSPHGQPMTQDTIRMLSQYHQLILLCGRYEGIDQRVIDTEVDLSVCVSDCIYSGGEIPALACIDAMIRCLPQALSNPESAEQDSFSAGLLDHPHYTRPLFFKNIGVPPVLLSGNHVKIRSWCSAQALKLTQKYRPDLLACHPEASQQSKDLPTSTPVGKQEE